jgi:hypothetical protein
LLIDSDRQKALQIITNAYKSLAAFDQGPTVQLIGLTIAAVGKQLGCEIALTADDFDTLRAHLPAATDRIDSIVSLLDQSLDDPFTLLETVLPFNFR